MSRHRPADPKKRWLGLPWWGWALVAVVLLCAGGGAFFWVESSLAVRLAEASPAEGALLASSEVEVSFSLPGYRPGRGTPTLSIDGVQVGESELTLRPDVVSATVSVPDGKHQAVLDYTSANVFSRHLARTVTFRTDTVAPGITINSPTTPQSLGEALVSFAAGLSEPARVQLTLDDVALPQASGG